MQNTLRVTREPNARAFHAALLQSSFIRIKEGVAKDSEEIRVICAATVSPKGSIASVTVGFWLYTLADNAPPQFFNHCHIYGSLGTVVPQFANLKVVMGKRDPQAWLELFDASSEIADELTGLLTVGSIRRAYDSGRFDRCFIRKEARAFLDSNWAPQV